LENVQSDESMVTIPAEMKFIVNQEELEFINTLNPNQKVEEAIEDVGTLGLDIEKLNFMAQGVGLQRTPIKLVPRTQTREDEEGTGKAVSPALRGFHPSISNPDDVRTPNKRKTQSPDKDQFQTPKKGKSKLPKRKTNNRHQRKGDGHLHKRKTHLGHQRKLFNTTGENDKAFYHTLKYAVKEDCKDGCAGILGQTHLKE
jgi:hypothetical protein